MNIKNLIIIIAISTFTQYSFSALNPDSNIATSSNSEVQDQHLLLQGIRSNKKTRDQDETKASLRTEIASLNKKIKTLEENNKRLDRDRDNFLKESQELKTNIEALLNEFCEYLNELDEKSKRHVLFSEQTIKAQYINQIDNLERSLNLYKFKSKFNINYSILFGSVFGSYLISNQKVKNFIRDKVVQTRKFIANKFKK